MDSFVFFLDFTEVWEFAEHVLDADVIPLLAFVGTEFGEYFGYLLVFGRYHVLGDFRHIDVHICIRNGLPLKESFLHLLSTTRGRSGL